VNDLTKPVKYSKSRFAKALKLRLRERGIRRMFDISYIDNDWGSQNIYMELSHKPNTGVLEDFHIEIGLFGDDVKCAGFGMRTASHRYQISAHQNQPINQYSTASNIIKNIRGYLKEHIKWSITHIQEDSYRTLFYLGMSLAPTFDDLFKDK